MVPAGGGMHLGLPVVRQAGEQRNCAAVLDVVGQDAALGDGAKAVLVLPGDAHVVRVEREDGILWRVLADPKESGGPGARSANARQLHVRTEGEGLCLHETHSQRERNEERGPAPDGGLQQVLSHQSAKQDEEDGVEQVESPHGLQPGETFEARGTGERNAGGGECQPEGNQGPRQLVENRSRALQPGAAEPPQERERREHAGPLVPGPVVNKEVGAGEERLARRSGGGPEVEQRRNGGKGDGRGGGGGPQPARGKTGDEHGAITAHLRVDQPRGRKPRQRPLRTVRNVAGHGEERGRSGKRTGREIRVHDGERRARNWYAEGSGEQRHRGPARPRFPEAGASEAPGGPEQQEDAHDVPGKDRQIGGTAQQTRGASHQVRKQRYAGVGKEELAAEGIEGRVGGLRDGGHVDGGVVHPEVVAVEEHGERRDARNGQPISKLVRVSTSASNTSTPWTSAQRGPWCSMPAISESLASGPAA